MTGLVRKALTIAAGLAVVASVASAGVPSPQQSIVEPVVVGDASGNAYGAPGSIGTQAVPGFEVTVRDVNLTPLANKNVVVDFSATTMKLHSTQNAGTTVNCAAKTISKLTNGSGVAVFSARVGGFTNTNNVEVSADGVVLALVKARSTDNDNAGATTSLTDYAACVAALAAVVPAQQFNFNLSVSEVPDLGDYAIVVTELATAATGAYCP